MSRIAILGDRNLDYVTHRELDAALGRFPSWADAAWVATDGDVAAALDAADGVWVAPGTPYRDDEAVYAAIGRAREEGLPLLGTCGGFQYAVVELARSLACIDAHHAETDPDADALVVAPLACSLVGEQRTVTCVPGTRLAAICGVEPFLGFHWCGYGLAPAFEQALATAGVVVCARAPDAGVEGIELPSHPFFMATLFQPQVGALAGEPLHALIAAFLDAAREPRAQVAAGPASTSAPYPGSTTPSISSSATLRYSPPV